MAKKILPMKLSPVDLKIFGTHLKMEEREAFTRFMSVRYPELETKVPYQTLVEQMLKDGLEWQLVKKLTAHFGTDRALYTNPIIDPEIGDRWICVGSVKLTGVRRISVVPQIIILGDLILLHGTHFDETASESFRRLVVVMGSLSASATLLVEGSLHVNESITCEKHLKVTGVLKVERSLEVKSAELPPIGYVREFSTFYDHVTLMLDPEVENRFTFHGAVSASKLRTKTIDA